MPEQLFANVASTTITSTITSGQTTLPVASSASFPSAVSAQDKEFQAAFLDDATTPPTIREYITVRNVNTSTSWTVIRAAEDASRFPAGAWTSGTRIVHLETAKGFRDLLPRSRNIYHDIRDFGAVGTNDTASGSATECGTAFFDAANAANLSVNEGFKTDANGTGVVYVPGNRDYKIGGAVAGTTESTVGTVPWPINVRMLGGTGTGTGTSHPPRIRWHGPANGIMFGTHTSNPNIAGIHVDNIKLDGRNEDGPTGAGHGFGAATAWEFGPATPGGSGGKVDTGCDFTDVHLGSFNGDGFRLMAGSTNFEWLRGRQDHIVGYAFYVYLATGFYGAIRDTTFDNAVGGTTGQSTGWLFIDGEDPLGNVKSYVSISGIHWEVNGDMIQSYLPTGWSETGCDTRGLVRFGIDPTHSGVVTHLMEYDNLWCAFAQNSRAPFSIFQCTSADLAGDHRDRHASAVRLTGKQYIGLLPGNDGTENGTGAVKFIGGIKDEDAYPYGPVNGTKQPNFFSWHPMAAFVPNSEQSLNYFHGRSQFTQVELRNRTGTRIPGTPDLSSTVMYTDNSAAKVKTSSGNVVTIAPNTKPTVSGSRGGNAALADLLTELATLGIITDSSTA